MTRKKTISDYTPEQLEAELLRRWAVAHFRSGMTMTEMELLIWETCGMENPAALRHLEALLGLMKPEKPTAKLCPRCGKRTPVKARHRERTLRTMAGYLTLNRNYHHCERCSYGFYPVDRALDVPEQGELTSEMEKRVLDFAINEVYGDAAERWRIHYRTSISDNLLRRVVKRVGEQCATAEQTRLQKALKPASADPADVLIVEVDGSMLPVCGAEPWKEAKLGVIYRHDLEARAPLEDSARYVAVLGGGMGEFAPLLQDALMVEDVDEARAVVCVGDGAPCNWNLADQLIPEAIQILDWYHAVENAMRCASVVLGEDSPYLPLWKQRIETLLMDEEPGQLIGELMDCVPAVQRGRGARDSLDALNQLVGYYRRNEVRMRYRSFRDQGLPLGSGAVESAHRHVLQARMKRAGMRWSMRNGRLMTRLRAAYRTAGARRVHACIRQAHIDTLAGRARRPERRTNYRYARYGTRDADRSRAASN